MSDMKPNLKAQPHIRETEDTMLDL